MAAQNLRWLSFIDRVQTFDGYWKDTQATARQLAAIGHVSDRPPLESLEEGSRCITCSHFVPKAVSIEVLEGSLFPGTSTAFQTASFHQPGCERLQVRMPFDPQAWSSEAEESYSFQDRKRIFERRRHHQQQQQQQSTIDAASSHTQQSSSLFVLPPELRVQIYAYLLPHLEPVTEIVPLNRDSVRLITRSACEKPGPRDATQTNILRTCRLVHAEALDMLLSSHRIFQFGSSKLLYLFLRRIGATGRALIRAVDVQGGGREDAMAFALLACCERLRSFTLRLPRPRILFPRPPIWCADGMASLLDLSGMEEVNFKPCFSQDPLDEMKADAAVVRRELTRPRGSPGRIGTVNGQPDV